MGMRTPPCSCFPRDGDPLVRRPVLVADRLRIVRQLHARLHRLAAALRLRPPADLPGARIILNRSPGRSSIGRTARASLARFVLRLVEPAGTADVLAFGHRITQCLPRGRPRRRIPARRAELSEDARDAEPGMPAPWRRMPVRDHPRNVQKIRRSANGRRIGDGRWPRFYRRLSGGSTTPLPARPFSPAPGAGAAPRRTGRRPRARGTGPAA